MQRVGEKEGVYSDSKKIPHRTTCPVTESKFEGSKSKELQIKGGVSQEGGAMTVLLEMGLGLEKREKGVGGNTNNKFPSYAGEITSVKERV